MLEKLNAMSADTLMQTLGIVYTDLGEDYLVATMPVNERVHQPMGLLHGGATIALASTPPRANVALDTSVISVECGKPPV